MKRIVGGAVVVLLFVAGVAYLIAARMQASAAVKEETAFLKRYVEIVAIGDEVAEQMKSADLSELSDFKEACDASLTVGEPDSLFSYFPAWSEGLAAQVPADSRIPKRQLAGASRRNTSGLVIRPAEPESRRTASERWWDDFVTEGTGYWERRREDHLYDFPTVDNARFLLVHQVRSAKLPVLVEDSKFIPGSALIHVRVVDVNDKRTACEGILKLRGIDHVEWTGSGRTQELAAAEAARHTASMVRWTFEKSILLSAMDAICAKGGASLCERTEYHYKWIN